MVSSTPRPHFTPRKDPVPISQEAVWVPGPVWTGGKSRPHRDSSRTVQPVAQSLYRLSYPAHRCITIQEINYYFLLKYEALLIHSIGTMECHSLNSYIGEPLLLDY